MTENVPENHGKYWTKEESLNLHILFLDGLSVEELAKRLKRTNNGIVSQLVRLNLVVNVTGRVYKIDSTIYYNGRK